MKNVSEIINQGNKNAELPAWLNMRHAWSANDAKRDEGLAYPDNVIQIKNLDYKKEPDHQKWCEAVELLASQRTIGEKTSEKDSRIFYYNEPDDASNLDSERYASNSLFDIYYPAEPDAQTTYPVIVSVHGGGWFYGDKELYSYYCCHLASKGFAVVNFNYRLAPQNKYPAAIEDVAYLIRYIHENAGMLHLDMSKFYMLGDSAGAQLTANYCIIAGNAVYRSKLDFFTYDRLPKAVCLNCGAYEMDKREENISDWYMKNEDGSYAVSEEQRKFFRSQLEYLTKDFPPAYLMYSVNDDLRFQTIYLDERMEKLGIRHVIRSFGEAHPDSGHVFHINLKNPEGIQCNEEECAWFRQYE